MTATAILHRLLERALDPFGFHDALRDLRLSADDMPGLTRECRQAGSGL